MPSPDEELERLVGTRQVEATLAEPVEFLGYGEPGDFALNVRESGLKTTFSSKRPMSSGRKIFDFVEKQNAVLMARENASQAPGAARLVAHEQLHAVKVQELGHVEAECAFAPEKIASEISLITSGG